MGVEESKWLYTRRGRASASSIASVTMLTLAHAGQSRQHSNKRPDLVQVTQSTYMQDLQLTQSRSLIHYKSLRPLDQALHRILMCHAVSDISVASAKKHNKFLKLQPLLSPDNTQLEDQTGIRRLVSLVKHDGARA